MASARLLHLLTLPRREMISLCQRRALPVWARSVSGITDEFTPNPATASCLTAVHGCSRSSFDRAFEDFRALDGRAQLHGSHVTGLAHTDSDLDLLSARPLVHIAETVRMAGESSAFKVLEHVIWARVQRLLLRHRSTGTVIDVISRSTSPQTTDRDQVVRTFLEYDPRAKDVAVRIGDWTRRHAESLPSRKGYPNSYTFRIVGFHHLVTRRGGPILPPLCREGCSLDRMTATNAAAGVSANQLFDEWLSVLATADESGLYVNLREPWRRATEPVWKIVDPIEGHNLTAFRGAQPSIIAQLARETLAKSGTET